MPVPFVSRLLVLLVFIAAASSVHAQSHIWTSLDQPPGVSDAIDLELAPWGDLYLLTYSGIYCSTDDGVSWKDCSFQYPSSFLVYDIAIDSAGNILAGGHGGSNAKRLYMSTNRGASWDAVDSYTNSSASAIAIGSKGEYFIGGPGTAGLQRSTDNGATWTSLRPRGIATQSINATGSGVILARGGSTVFNGLWRSVDGGETWDSLGVEGYLQDFRQLNGDTLIAIRMTGSETSGRLVRSLDNGVNWSLVNTAGTIIGIIDIGIRSNGTVLLPTVSGILHTSTDRLRTWTHVNPETLPNSLTTIVETSGGTLVAVGPTGPYRSSDGVTWETSYQGLNAFVLHSLYDPGAGVLLGYANYGGLIQSDDKGESWQHAGLDGQFHTVVQVVATGEGKSAVLMSSGIFMQADSNRFNYLSIPPNVVLQKIAAVSYLDSLYLIALQAGAPSYVSSDTGKTWRAIDSLPTTKIVSVNAVATAATGLFYVATSAGLFRMQVPEFLFHKVINGPGTSALKGVAATDEGLVLALTQDSIWRSTNNGTTWQSFGRVDEGMFQAYTIARDGAIITSTTQGNIYLRRLADDGWRDISGELKGNALHQLLAHRDGDVYALTNSSQIYRMSEIPASVGRRAASVSMSAVIEPSVVSHYATLRLSVRTPDEYHIDVYDAHGEVVLSIPSFTLASGEHWIPLDLSHLHSGRYWCSVWSDAAMTLCTLQVIR